MPVIYTARIFEIPSVQDGDEELKFVFLSFFKF